MSTPQAKTLKSSDGTVIYAEFIGDRRKPCLTLVHGFSMSCLVWDDIFRDAALLDEACMARYDLRGHGRSGRPEKREAYESSLHADDFIAVVRALHIQKSILSYGGTIACDVAAHIGADVLSGIIYVAAFAHLGPPMLPDAITSSNTAMLKTQQSPPDVASFMRAKVEQFQGIWVDSDALDYRFRLALLATSLTQTPQLIESMFQRSQDPKPLLEVLQSGKPTLMLYGDQDKLLNCEYVRRVMEPWCAALDVCVVKGGGHAPFYEHREAFVGEVLRFIRRVAQRSRL